MKIGHWLAFVVVALAAYYVGKHYPTMVPLIP
jgi:hypothetical protein